MSMWNCLELQCPVNDMCDYIPQESFMIEDLRNFVTVLTTSANILTLEQPLFNELHIFHNIQAKYRRILQCDKSLVYLARVGHCLKKFILLNLSKCYLDLAERFLVGFQSFPSTVSLPSRQQVEYILIRTQAAAKLVCEGIKYSRHTFCFLVKKLKIGHIIIDLVMAASVTARLNILLKTVAVQLCDMYQKVLVWQHKLKQGSYQWKEKLSLPQNLENWLDVSEAEFKKSYPMTKDDVEFFKPFFKTQTENTESDSDSVIFINQENEVQVVEESADKTNDTDYGEIIPRQETSELPQSILRSLLLVPKQVKARKARKQVKAGSSKLTSEQKKFLHRIVQVKTFKKLEIIWKNSLNSTFPKPLDAKKKKIISTFLLELRGRKSEEANSRAKMQTQTDASIAGMMLAKHLGFTQIQIDDCRSAVQTQVADTNSVASTNPVALTPVKTVKGLKALYNHICEMLQSTNQIQKQKKLRKIFKRRLVDIKLLKKNGDKQTAKNLTYCTSKVILALYKK